MTDEQFLVEAHLAILEARATSEVRVLMELQRLFQEDAKSATPTRVRHKPRSKSAITHREYLMKMNVQAASRARASQPA